MKRERFLPLLLAFLMLLSLPVGCGGSSPAPSEDEYTLAPEEGCNQLTLY